MNEQATKSDVAFTTMGMVLYLLHPTTRQKCVMLRDQFQGCRGGCMGCWLADSYALQPPAPILVT